MTPAPKRTPSRTRPVDFNVEQALSTESRLTALETKASIFQWVLGIIVAAGAIQAFRVFFSS